MDASSIIKLGLRSRTLPGGIELFLVVFFGISFIAFLKSTYNRDSFTCEPETSSITKQLCYDEYSSAMNQWFTPLYFVVLAYLVLLVLSISFMLYGAFTLRELKRDHQKKPDCFRRVYLLHVCCRLILILVMNGIFCGNQTLIVPKTYKCSVAAVTTPIPLNQTETDLHCHDQNYREKSISNIAIIVVKVFIMILCIIEFIQVVFTPADKLPGKLLGLVFEDDESPLEEKQFSANIPIQAPNYIDRTQVENEIIEKLSADVRMIVIIALPGMGKTQVAIRVCHLLARKKQRVIFVKKQMTLSDICSEILYVLCGEDWMTGNDDIVQQATHKLSELKKDTVIVMDNTEDIQEQEDFDGFAQTLLASAPKVKLMITTRRNVKTVSADIHRVHLKPMDTNSSAKLLKDVFVVCKEYLEEVCRLCGGMPLILINCMYLLKNDFNPKVLVEQLRNDPIDILKNNSEDVYNLLGKFLREFPSDIKRNLVRVSVFPSTFSAEDMLILFETRAEVETVKTKMVKGSLLQTTEDGKYSVHPLVQAFCRKEGGSLDVGEEGDKAKQKFNQHYLKRIKILSKQFTTKDKACKAISTFRKEKANITEAFKNCLEDTTVKEEKLFAIDVANSTEVLDFLAKVFLPPKECTQLYEKCCEISRDCDDKERLADSLNSVGFRHLSSCDAAHLRDDHKILNIYQEAYNIRMTLPEEKQECQTHAHTISKLGFCYFLQGEELEEKGRRLIQEGINIRKKLGVPLYVAAGYSELARTYRYRADHRNAIRIWEEETLPVYERELGEHPWTASILYFIATSYKIIAKRESGDYAEKGKTKIMAALEIQEKLLGIHLDTARSYVCLGAILKIQGELKLALEELEKGLKIREDVLGPHHEKTIETREFKARVQRLYEGSN